MLDPEHFTDLPTTQRRLGNRGNGNRAAYNYPITNQTQQMTDLEDYNHIVLTKPMSINTVGHQSPMATKMNGFPNKIKGSEKLNDRYNQATNFNIISPMSLKNNAPSLANNSNEHLNSRVSNHNLDS